MKIRKILKSLFPVMVATVLTMFVMLIYIFDANFIAHKSTDDFNTDAHGFCYDIEQSSAGSFFSSISGYCFHTSNMEEYYNFGLGISGKASYINNTLCLVEGDNVYVLPSVQQVRQDLLSLPQASEISNTVGYNFYAGVQSKYCNLLFPDGNYRIGIIYTDIEGESYLLISDKELVK